MANLDGFTEAGNSGESWNEEKPVMGIYKNKKSDVGPHSSNVYILETEEGENVSVWGSTVLDNKFSEIPINSTVYVESLGKVKGKHGSSYKDYKVMYKIDPLQKVFPGATEVE